MSIFPPPPSSAGHPRTVMELPWSLGQAFMAACTPKPAATPERRKSHQLQVRTRQPLASCSDCVPASAIRLCPQACPMSGRASYSHMTATFPPPGCRVPHVALKAVERENSLSTWKPLSSRNCVRRAWACFSWYSSSGWLHISELSSFRAEELLSIASAACFFAIASIYEL